MNLLLGENVERISAFFKLFGKRIRKEKKLICFQPSMSDEISYSILRNTHRLQSASLVFLNLDPYSLRLYVKQKVASSELILRPDVLFCFIMEISPSTVCFLFSFAKKPCLSYFYEICYPRSNNETNLVFFFFSLQPSLLRFL